MLAAEQHGEEATARRRGGLQQRATPSSNTSTLRFTAPMRFTWFYNSDASELASDASELATRVSDQRILVNVSSLALPPSLSQFW